MGIAERNVEHGLEMIEPGRTVEIPLRDALFAYKVIGEFVRFFHQPLHWNKLEDVQAFIGDRDEGALHVLWEAYYQRLRDVWPPDVEKAFDDGAIDHPFREGAG